MLRLAGGDGKPRVDNDDAGSLGDCLGEFLHLGIVHVLAQVASDQDETLGIPYVGPFRGSRVLPEGQPEPGIPWPAALRERWRRDVGCSESAQGVFRKVPPMPWLKSATASGP